MTAKDTYNREHIFENPGRVSGLTDVFDLQWPVVEGQIYLANNKPFALYYTYEID